VLERYNYTPYGTPTVLDANFAADADQISDIGNTHLYTGRERDPETGLQLNRHRCYASHLGRWLTRDPIGYYVGLNLYNYVLNLVLRSVDPSGLLEIIPEELPPWIEPAPDPGKIPFPQSAGEYFTRPIVVFPTTPLRPYPNAPIVTPEEPSTLELAIDAIVCLLGGPRGPRAPSPAPKPYIRPDLDPSHVFYGEYPRPPGPDVGSPNLPRIR
jgi:RHS repeat-associated protein